MLKVLECKYNWQYFKAKFLPEKWGSCSIVPNSLRPHGLQPTRLICHEIFPGKNTGVGCHLLLQGIFPTQGSNPSLLHCRQSVYRRSYKGTLEKSIPNGVWNLKCKGKDRYKLLDFKKSQSFCRTENMMDQMKQLTGVVVCNMFDQRLADNSWTLGKKTKNLVGKIDISQRNVDY